MTSNAGVQVLTLIFVPYDIGVWGWWWLSSIDPVRQPCERVLVTTSNLRY